MKTGGFTGSHTAISLSLKKGNSSIVGSKLVDEMKEKKLSFYT